MTRIYVLAVAYDGGVVLGCDSRVSTGVYVSNRASDKVTALSDFAWLLRSGSAADTQAVADYGEFDAGTLPLLNTGKQRGQHPDHRGCLQ